MAARVALMNKLGAFMMLNNITTLITPNPTAPPETEASCMAKYKNFAKLVPGNVNNYCEPVFDGYLCWPPTNLGATIQQNCPNIHLSDTSHYASRRCAENGLWKTQDNNTNSQGWTNFTQCFDEVIRVLILEGFHDTGMNVTKFDIAQNSRYIEITGYVISCVSILISLYIYFSFRTLQNTRTLIHKHVFYSLLFNTVTCLVIFIDQLITRKNIGDQTTKLNLKGIDNTPSLCKALYFIAEYSTSTIFSWVFVEGLHLNYLISNMVLQQFNFRLYCFIAWLMPLLLTSVWGVVVWLSYRWDTVKECWYGYNFAESYWILQGSRLIVLLCNTIILIKVMKMVVQKLKDARTPENIKILKSVKAALFLIPILGISNVLAAFDTPLNTPIYGFMALSYTRQFLKSFQGFLLSLVYCLGNEEVRTVVMKRIRTIFVSENFDRIPIIHWLLPRQHVIEPLSQLDFTSPPTFEEATVWQDMRTSSDTRQPPPPYELPLAVISDSEGLQFGQNHQPFESETSFTDIVLSRHIDSDVEDEIYYERENDRDNINEYRYEHETWI